MRELILERFGLDFMESTREQLAEVLDEPMRPGGDVGRGRGRHLLARRSSRRSTSRRTCSTSRSSRSRSPSRHAEHPELAEHFDAVIGGIEMVSGDTELNDPVDQWQRFVDQRKRRMVDDEDVPHPNDEEYARAIEYGYSPTAGGGMGVDRLIMILTERETLREVIPFPIVQGPQVSSNGARKRRAPNGADRGKLELDPGVVACLPRGGAPDRRRRSPSRSRARRPSRSSARHAPARRRRRQRARGAAAERARRPRARPRRAGRAASPTGSATRCWPTRRRRRSRSPRRSTAASSTLVRAAARRRDEAIRERIAASASARGRDRRAHARARAMRERLGEQPPPLRYVLTATGNVYEDVVHAQAVAQAGGDIVAVIRSTAQSLLDYVPYGPTTEGYGGTFATQANFRIMREALDEWSRAARPLRAPVELLLGPVHAGDRRDGRERGLRQHGQRRPLRDPLPRHQHPCAG